MTPSVFILGLHYGGTSAVAAVVESFGYDLGETGDANATHPLGNKEDQDFLMWCWEACEGNDREPREDVDDVMLARLQAMIERRDARGVPWGVKLPLLDFYGIYALRYAQQPVVVQVLRGLQAATESYAAKENVSLDVARAVHDRYDRAISRVRLAHPTTPWHKVRYTELTKNPDPELHALWRFLRPIDERAILAAKQLVLPEWRHF